MNSVLKSCHLAECVLIVQWVKQCLYIIYIMCKVQHRNKPLSKRITIYPVLFVWLRACLRSVRVVVAQPCSRQTRHLFELVIACVCLPRVGRRVARGNSSAQSAKFTHILNVQINHIHVSYNINIYLQYLYTTEQPFSQSLHVYAQ